MRKSRMMSDHMYVNNGHLIPDYEDSQVALFLGDCRDILPRIVTGSVSAMIYDPPYPEIRRDYGRFTEGEWHDLMRFAVAESRRIVAESGSMMAVLQPNSEHIGQMRLWLWEFVVWAAHEWNLVQDAYWWNHAALPTAHCQRTQGLMRPSVKHCIWLGSPDCYRDQDAVLLPLSKQPGVEKRVGVEHKPSGHRVNNATIFKAGQERGGTTPFNMLQIGNTYRKDSAGAFGHGAGTPLNLCDWWVRYITKAGDVVLDPFMGSGTTGIAALTRGRRFVGIERDERYFEIAVERFRKLRLDAAVELPPSQQRQHGFEKMWGCPV